MTDADAAALTLTVVMAVLSGLGAAVGIGAAIRGRGSRRSPGSGSGSGAGLLRVAGVVHTGWEQTLLGLIRELALPRAAGAVGYGQLYVEPQSEHRLLVRSRSELGRGFVGSLTIDPRIGSTGVTYAILRLPSDEQVNEKVLDFELQLVRALRRLDPRVEVQLTAGALTALQEVTADGVA